MSDELVELGSLVPANFDVDAGALAELDEISNDTGFLARIQLYGKGKAVDKKLIPSGHYGSPASKEEIVDLGDSIDVIPFARRAKAIDMSDRENIKVSYDQTSDLFKYIKAQSTVKDSSCQFGVSYLVFERSTGKFYEFFCGTKSAKKESAKINTYLPKFMGGAKDNAVPMQLSAKLCEKGDWTWFAPKAGDCPTPFTADDLPPVEKIKQQIEDFLSPNEEAVEVADDGDNGRAR